MTSVEKLRRVGSLVTSLAVTLVAATAALAHHSFAMFDGKKELVYEGTVAEFQWINPHAFLLLDVPTKNGVKRYSFETGHPGGMKEAGWNRASLKRGDVVKVVAFPLRNGRAGGMLIEVVFRDGKKLETGARGLGVK